ncbi:MAG: sigma-70 family RNA polymerase sigma factor [Alphaproteobacteria bacterium]
MTDLEVRLKGLMLRGLAGDAAAHANLLGELTRYLRAFFAKRLGRGAADLEDLVQETLLAIHTKRETYDRNQPFTAWAYAIARYKLVDQFRRNRVRRTEPIESAEELFAAEDAEEGATRLDLNRLMAELPERQRALLEDVKLRGFSNAEAGKKAGMTETAVKVSIHRSLKALARRVRNED